MSEHPHSKAMMDRKNLIHILPTVVSHDVTQIGPKGLYKLKGNQAVNINAQYRYHDINPQTTPSTFSSANFMDFHVPQTLHVVDKLSLFMTLANADASNAWEADLPTEFWVRRAEVRQGGEVIQTLESLDSYLRHSVFKNPEELTHQQARNGMNSSTRQGDTTATTIALSSSAEFSLDLETLLDQCNVFVQGLSKEVTIRIYLENIANFSDSAQNADITLTSAKLRIREQYYSGPDVARMSKNYSNGVDHRFCDAIIETTTQTLTSNTNNKYITQNFNGELSPVQFVVIRDMSDIDANSDAFKQISTIHREDVSGQNLENGIVHKDADLRNFNYPDYFQNDQSQVTSGNKYVYALVASLDPVSAVKRGINTGYRVLGKNEKLVINPGSSTLTSHQIDYVCYIYRHLRVSNGILRVY